MGYSHRFHKIPKNEICEIKTLKTAAGLYDWAKYHGYHVYEPNGNEDGYFALYDLGKCIYDFGKDVDWAFVMQQSNDSLFDSDKLKAYYEDNQPVICSANDFLTAINSYKQQIIKYYKSLLVKTEYDSQTIEQKQQYHIRRQLREWENDFDYQPIDTDPANDRICQSHCYEYAIFELVRLYKTFDWEHDAIVLLGG